MTIHGTRPIHDSAEIADAVVRKLRDEAGFIIDDATVTADEILDLLEIARFEPITTTQPANQVTDSEEGQRPRIFVQASQLLFDIRKRLGLPTNTDWMRTATGITRAEVNRIKREEDR